MASFLFFLQRFWSTIGPSCVTIINQIFSEGQFLRSSMPLSFDSFPKKDTPKLVFQFPLIVLCNVLMKVVINAIANRLKPMMEKLIGDTQSSFIPGR